jgi:hypothetical protein
MLKLAPSRLLGYLVTAMDLRKRARLYVKKARPIAATIRQWDQTA